MPTERARLAQAAEALRLDISDDQQGKLLRYLDLLETWNRTYNLTAIRDRASMLVQHIFDSLSLIAPLRASGFLPQSGARLLDVGSGGGLPGVVVAIFCPDVEVVCVDAVRKKATFIRQVALESALPNLRAEHARVEALDAGQFDIITSRAFASLDDFIRLTSNLIRPYGRWVAMKGQLPETEIAALSESVEVFHVEQLHVPELEAARCLVWIKPKR